MILRTNDTLWNRLYYPIRDSIMNSESWPNIPGKSTTEKLEAGFMEMGIRLIKGVTMESTQTDNWSHVELPDGDDLIMLLMRWG